MGSTRCRRGVKIATLASCPVFGGKVAHVDDERAKIVPGVRQVIVLDDLVAVDVGPQEGPRGRRHHMGRRTKRRSLDGRRHGLVAASEKAGAVAKSAGGIDKALEGGTKLEATYHVPFLAHAPMEPMNCTVHVRPDACEIWVGNQVITRAQGIAAKVTGLPAENVVVHNHLIGGGFGRRLEVDYIGKAVRIAQKVDVVPIGLQSRNKSDAVPMLCCIQAIQSASGRVQSWVAVNGGKRGWGCDGGA